LKNIATCDFKLESNLGEEGAAYVINWNSTKIWDRKK
jgi:hypothetical protein